MSDNHPLLASGLSGRDHYATLYARELQREAVWLRCMASQKASSIAALLSGGIHSILEVGAGTGAVIGELRRMGIGEAHYAVDFSTEAVDEINRAEPGIITAVADITQTPDPFGVGMYDLVFASHVLEHLESPGRFLEALHAIPMRLLALEVPLENLFFGRLKARMSNRAHHPAGHVQFFDRAGFEALVRESGWQINRSRAYGPHLDADSFHFTYSDAPMRRRVLKRFTEDLGPRNLGRFWTRWYHAHYTVLCSPFPPHESRID